MAAADGRQINLCFKMQELCKAVKGVADDCPTIDPESMRPKEGWVSVKDMLPEVFDEVLVYDTFCDNHISIAWRETVPRKNGIVSCKQSASILAGLYNAQGWQNWQTV